MNLEGFMFIEIKSDREKETVPYEYDCTYIWSLIKHNKWSNQTERDLKTKQTETDSQKQSTS